MPNTQSAEKRLRQGGKRRLRNRATKSQMKTEIKKALAALRQSNRSIAEPAVRQAIRLIDKAAIKGVIHANEAARRKSRLTVKLKSVV